MSAAKDIFQKYYLQLVKMLPMDDSMFVSGLYTHNILTLEDKSEIMSWPTRADKVVAFLDHVIAPSIIAGYDGKFYQLLKCMKDYELSVIRELAKNINAALHNDDRAPNSAKKRFRFEQCDEPTDVHASRGVLKNCPSLKQLNQYSHHFCTKWYSLGIQLLNDMEMHKLEIIKRNYASDSERCCMEMLNLWLSIESSANWEKLIDTLKSIDMNAVAAQILEDLCGNLTPEDLAPFKAPDKVFEGPYPKGKSRSCEELSRDTRNLTPEDLARFKVPVKGRAKSRSWEEPSRDIRNLTPEDLALIKAPDEVFEGPYETVKSRSCEEPSGDIRNLKPEDLAQFKAPDKVNTHPLMKDLVKFVVPQYSANWEMLGILLDLPSSLLDTISHDHAQSSMQCCCAMLEKWLQRDPTTSWRKLLEAIKLLK